MGLSQNYLKNLLLLRYSYAKILGFPKSIGKV